MTFAPVYRFPFQTDGNAARRDRDALPRYLICGMDFDHYEIRFHEAGDDCIRARCVIDAMSDEDFIEGFTPSDAARIALEYARARQGERGTR